MRADGLTETIPRDETGHQKDHKQDSEPYGHRTQRTVKKVDPLGPRLRLLDGQRTVPQRPFGPLRADEAVWEASRLNTMLANKGYRESDVTQWWNFTAHDQLDGQTIAEAWRNGRYDEVRALIEQLPEREMPH